MVITKDKAIEMLKQGRFLCGTQWGGYRYWIGINGGLIDDRQTQGTGKV